MKSGSHTAIAYGAVALIAAMWLGMLLGVSFLATPIKFHAQSLELAVALDVGRVTFAAFSKVERGLAILLALAAVWPGRKRSEFALALTVVAIVFLQVFWLLPALDMRVAAVIAGNPLPASLHHPLYAALEAIKALLLAATAAIAVSRLIRANATERGWGMIACD